MLTPRDIEILKVIAQYYVLNRDQIQRLCFPSDPNGRTTRRRLQVLVQGEFIRRHTLFPFQAHFGAPAPVYYPSKQGCEFLADQLGDERYRLTCTAPPQPNNLLHWLSISDFHIALNASTALQAGVRVEDWINEWDIVNKDESKPELRYRLYSLLDPSPRLVCAPDAGFVLRVNQYRKAFYLELDRGSVSVSQLAASRPKGYAALAERRLHRRHFPNVNVEPFTVLLVTTTIHRRDTLRRELAKQPGASLWKVATIGECTPEALLMTPIFHPCGEGQAAPLVKPELIAAPTAEAAS